MKPLASLLRPQTLKDFIGQNHIIGESTPLYEAIAQGRLPHCIFFGPTGSGKTSLARILARSIGGDFHELNATHFRLEELRKILSQGTLLKTLIFIDEIHRLNKIQQEALLPIMEEDQACIIGSSTLNPCFSLTQAIRSRSFVFEFRPLDSQEMNLLLSKALQRLQLEIPSQARAYLIASSHGDARAMLNLLDLAALAPPITLGSLQSLRPHALGEGVSEDEVHYQLASALIKSLRGSDVDASIYYLARLIEAQESAEFIARRLVIFASEDIGNANPNALILATSTLTAVSKIGYPEARILLSQCVIYLASSPKSNTAYTAINQALDFVRSTPLLPIPSHLIPHSQDYLYPHDFGGWVQQDYAPTHEKFVQRTGKGFEKTLNEWLEKIRNR